MRTVLDASALLAGLRREPGAERVGAALDAAVISTVNLAEVVAGLARNGATEKEVRAAIRTVSVTAIPPDEEMAVDAGLLRGVTDRAGLSLGDRFCLALARRLGAPALTADRKWAAVAAEVEVAVELIR
ncbi:MAG: type II toxin-antitoxin system VapC family toxin [Sphingosinicella sp.]|uniref:type II toxin-antitoxin system VapC family toxin n=1 Tax=Sphingosinicella sp. TaxID=1917971 RepID=UPI004038436D